MDEKSSRTSERTIMETIQAIYENGVFRPVAPVTLPEQTRVTVIPEAKMEEGIGSNSDDLYALLEARFESGVSDGASRVDDIYEILDRRYNSGHADTAARHNEHQP